MLISNTKSSFQENIQDEADDDDLNLNDIIKETALSKEDNENLILEIENKGKTLDELMIIFKENEAKIQPKSIVYFIRKILNLLHETNSQSLLFFGRNQSMNQFLTYFQTNITVMNEYQFVEILVLIRRFKDLNLDFGGKVDSLIKKIIPLLENYKSLNLKLAAQIFHEYSLLNIDTKNIFMFINKMLNDSSQQPYFTGYAISIIIKACSHNYVKTKKNFYASFCYKLLNMLEKHLKHFKLGALCRLFKNICVLQLNIYTPHQRLHSVIIQIKGIIQEQKADLQEKDLLCLLEAFIHAPVSFDNSLLLYLKSTTLHTMQETPKTLTLKFLIRFVDLMGQQFKEIRLKEESLDRIGREILKRLQYSENIKFSLMFDCIKAFAQKNFYYHKNLFHFLYKKIITTPENEININLTVFMIKILIPIKFDCRELLFILKTKVVKQDFVIHIDKLLDLMYIYSYPLNSKTSEFVTFCTDALNAIKKQLDAKKLEITNSFLFILAREYCYVSNPYFIELHTMALTILKNEWDKLRPIRRLDLALSFINVKVKKQEWHLFLNEKIMNLDEENLKLLLNTYCLKEAKDYSSFDLVLKALLTSPQENLKKQLKNIIEAFIRTPPFKIINLKGNPNHKIFQLIELIDWNIEIQEFKISYTEVLKFVRFFNALDMNTDFLLPIFLHPWKKGTLIQSFQAGDLGLIEIGAFITESVLLSSNYYKIRKNIKISNNLSSEKKLQNNDINLGNKEDFTIISTEKPIETLKNSENLTLELDNNKEGSENMEVNTIISFDKSLENMDSRTKGNNIGDILNISQEIFNNLKSYFEIGLKTKKYDISLSWISKFLRIYIFLFEYQPNFDKVLLPIIFQQIKNKLDKRIIDNRPTIVKTMFLLIELDLLKAEFTLEQREYIRQNLESSLDKTSIPILLPFLKHLQRAIKTNIEKKAFRLYLKTLEDFYMKNEFKKFPNVIAKFFFFLACIGVEHSNIYNKIIEDIQNNFEYFRANQLLEILESLSIMKIQHRSLGLSISKKIQISISIYQRNIPDIVFIFAKLGFRDNWCEDICRNLWTHYKKTILAKKANFYRPIDVFWSLLVMNLTNGELISEHFTIFQNYLLKYYKFDSISKDSYISEIYCSLFFLFPDRKDLHLTFELVKKLKTLNFFQNISKKDLPVLEEILKKNNEEFIKNYLIDDCFLVNIYLPHRKLLIVFDNTIYVGYDNFSPTGHSHIRKLILEKLKTTKGFSFINVNELRLNSCENEETRIEYLKKEGLDLKESRLIS